MNRIFMACYGGGHVKIIAPLYHYFTERGNHIDILALTTAASYLDQEHIPYLTYADFPALFTTQAQQHGAILAQTLDTTLISKRQTESYLGVSFNELVQTHGLEAAQRLYDELGRSAFLPVKSLRHILAQLTPDIVITTNSPRSERATLMAAKAQQIPSVCINDFLPVEGGCLEVANQNLANKICVLTDSVKQDLLRQSNYPETNIIVTGSPVFDSIKRLRQARQKKKGDEPITILLADYQIPTKHPTLDDEYGDPLYADKVRAACDKLALKNNWQFIFRPHPNQPLDYSPYRNITISTPSEPLHPLLMKTDITITAVSTVGLEALVAGNQLISLENTVFSKHGFSYAKAGLAHGIESADALESAILHIQNNEIEAVNLYDGIAVENIATVVDALLK